jgi:outer membrane protein, heavy metal efflux system
MKKICFLLTLLVISLPITAQDIDAVLASVSENNKTLIAAQQNLEAKKMAFRSFQPLYNPNVEYDYMKGFPETAGNQQDLLVNQAFDFPTSYGIRKKLAGQLDAQYEFEYLSTRQSVLLEAKRTCLGLIFARKLDPRIRERKAMTERLLADFEKKLETGDGNILDVNKARLQLIEINKEYQMNQALIRQLEEKLEGLNGGIPLPLVQQEYESGDVLGSLEDLFAEIQTMDPMVQFYILGNSSAERQVALTKSLALPKLEAGYRQQAILGQSFQGFHIGTTIPLWENKYQVRQSQEEKTFSSLALQDYKNERYFTLRQQYEKLEKLGMTLEEYHSVLSALNDIEYLNKALSVGHISTIEYFLESNYFYTAFTNYLKTEQEYHVLLAEILQHRL